MTKQELKTKIDKLENGIKSKATPSNLIAPLKAQKAKLEKELEDMEAAEKKAVKTKKVSKVAEKIKAAKTSVAKKTPAKAPAKEERKKDNVVRDGDRKSLPAGKRISKTGKVYYEMRANRTDKQTSKKPYLADGGILTDAKKEAILKKKGNIIIFKEVLEPTDEGRKSIAVQRFVKSRKTEAVKLEGSAYDTQWFESMQDLINAVDWSKWESNKYANGGEVSKKYVVFFTRFNNGKSVPRVVEMYDNESDAKEYVESQKKLGEKGFKIKQAKDMPIYSMINIVDKSKYKELKDLIHSKDKVDAFFDGKDSFYKKDYGWVKPYGYVWENWKLVSAPNETMAKGGAVKKAPMIYEFKAILRDEDDKIIEKKEFKVRATARDSAYNKAYKKYPRPYFVELYNSYSADKMADGGDIYDDMEEDIDFANDKAKKIVNSLESLGYKVVKLHEADYDTDAQIELSEKVNIQVGLEGDLSIVIEKEEGKFTYIDCGKSYATLLIKLSNIDKQYMEKGGKTKRTVKLTLSDKDSYDYTYKQDGATASITFGFGKEPFQYEVKKISKSLEPLKQDILDTFTLQGIKQHEYKGGFSEAIKHLDTSILENADEFAKGGYNYSPSSNLKENEYQKLYNKLKERKDKGENLDSREEYAYSKAEYVLKTRGLLNKEDKMAKGGVIKISLSDIEGADFQSLSQIFESNDTDFSVDEDEEFVLMDLKGLPDGEDKEQAYDIIGKYKVKRMADGGKLDKDISDKIDQDLKLIDTKKEKYKKELNQLKSENSQDRDTISYLEYELESLDKLHQKLSIIKNSKMSHGGYVIFEGRDNYNDKPLYKVISKDEDNDYDGEFHDNREDAEKELKELKNKDMNYAKGGKLDKYNVSFNYNPSNLSNEDAERIVSSYTKDWRHNNDFDEVSFYVMRLNKSDADMLVKELKMEDVYNIEVDKSNYASGGYMADGGDSDEPSDEMEKLVEEHINEAKRNRVKITNLGSNQGDDFIVSKTTQRKDGSDVLTSEISNGVVTHDWDSYKKGGYMAKGGKVPAHFGSGKNIDVFGYQTENFDICGTAVKEFESAMEIMQNAKESEKESLARCAKYVDGLFGIEKLVVETAGADDANFYEAVSDIMSASIYNYRAEMSINLFSFVPQHLKEIAVRMAKAEKGGLYALGGMTAGRWYRDKSGEEFKFIGKIDSGENKGKFLFTDGQKSVYKDLEDFEGGKPKETKLFGFFENGGEMELGGMLIHGFQTGDTILEIYKGYGIVENNNNGVIEVLNPNRGTRFIIDLDESKPTGEKSMGMSKEKQIESAKGYIDYLDNPLPDTLLEKFRAEGKMADGGKVDVKDLTYPKYEVSKPEFEAGFGKGKFKFPDKWEVGGFRFDKEKDANAFYDKLKGIDNMSDYLEINTIKMQDFFDKKYQPSEYKEPKVGSPYPFSAFQKAKHKQQFQFLEVKGGEEYTIDFVLDKVVLDKALGWRKFGNEWVYGDYIYDFEGYASVGSGAIKLILVKTMEKGGYMAKGGNTNYTKTWKVVGRTMQGKLFEKEITLGRMSDRNDVMNALKRMPNTQIREITFIGERFKAAEGGYMADGGKVGKMYFKNGDIVYVFQSASDKNGKLRKGIDSKYVVGNEKEHNLQKWAKVEVIEPISDEMGWERYRGKKIDGDYDLYDRKAKNGEMVAFMQSNSSKYNTEPISMGYSEEQRFMAKGGDLSSIKKKYEENEDENAHSENVVLLAKNFGSKEDLAKAKEILALHEKEGSLSSENGKKRQELHLKLIDKARAEMGKQGIEFEKGGYMAKGGSLKDRSERDSIKLSKEYQKVLDSNFDDKVYEKYQKLVKETQIPKDELQKIEQYVMTTPKGQRRDVDIYKYWGVGKMADGGMMNDGVKIKVGDEVELQNGVKAKVTKLRAIGRGGDRYFVVKLPEKYGSQLITVYKKDVVKLASGGKVKFADKVKSVQESLLKRKKVAPQVQKDYGKSYSKAEAKESAQRIVGSRMAQLKEKMAKKKK
jgi:hypothetical protein